jgi:membrane-bound serine protease (ClpP class)
MIDLIAVNVPDLLRQVNGRSVEIAGNVRLLAIQGLTVETLRSDDVYPAIVPSHGGYILQLVGIYGPFSKLAHLDLVASAVLGGICLLLVLFAFQVTLVNTAGPALLLTRTGVPGH